jgi:K(+)-stimulated pyrophosphate-energized sodium pump
MSNAGGAWDNAKKCIEDEPCSIDGNTGKGSERHKCGVVGDTIGDPLKDTAGPALNPMIKVVNLLALILAPLLVQFTFGADATINLVLVAVLFVLFLITVWAIRKSTKPADFGMGTPVEAPAEAQNV